MLFVSFLTKRRWEETFARLSKLTPCLPTESYQFVATLNVATTGVTTSRIFTSTSPFTERLLSKPSTFSIVNKIEVKSYK